MEEARAPSYWWCYECRKEVTPEPGVALDLNLNLNSNPNPVCCLCQEGFLERIYASSSVAAGIGLGSGNPHESRLLWNEPPQSLYFHDFFGVIRSSPYRALSLDNHDRDHNYSNEGEGEKAVDYLDCFSDGIDSNGHFLPEGRIVEEEEEQLWENLGVSENFYAASEGEVEPGTSRRWEEIPRMIWDEFEVKIDSESRGRLEERRRVTSYEIELEGESFIGNVDPRDNDLDEAAKNSLSFSRNSDGNDCFFTALADDPADAESVGSNSVDHSGSSPYPTAPSDGCPSIHAEMGDLMLAFNAWDSFEVHDEEESEDDEQWEEVLGEEAVTAASADDTAEVNFNFGSTEGIILPAAEEEEEEEQVSDAEDSRSLPLLERSELAGMMQMLVNFNLEDEDVDEEEDDDGDVYYGVPEDYVDAAGYEIVLQHQHEHENFAENNDDFLTGAPPASKAAVESLPSIWIGQKDFELLLMCAICKDPLSVGELAKQLPCRHSYHADCILPWLISRNSCPLCRYELPTDDPAYEEQRKQGASLRT